MASIKDIAAQTGLSLATISRVFNNSPKVSDKTREKVLRVAAKLNYVPHMGAASLRSGKSRVIGVLLPEINNRFFSEVITAIERELKKWNYNIIISQTHESAKVEREMLQSFMQLSVDGVIISTSKEASDPSVFKKLNDKNIPIVFFDRKPPVDFSSSIMLNDYAGGQMATQHLIDQGCKHIIHIAGNDSVSIFEKRQMGFQDALGHNNLPLSPHQIVRLAKNKQDNKLLIQKLLQKYPDIDGFFSFGDYHALYIMDILRSMNIEIPKQIKVVGFGNTDFTTHIQPSLTTVDQNCHEMGCLAAETLMKQLESNEIAVSKKVLSPKLIIRNSSVWN